MSQNALGATLIIFILTITGCGPSIEIRHQDPTYPTVQVKIDNGKTKTLEYGDEVSVSVSKGSHLVQAFPQGENQCPWTEDGEGWTIWVEKEAELTLLTPKQSDPLSPTSTRDGAVEK